MPTYTLTVTLPSDYDPYGGYVFINETCAPTELFVGSGLDDFAQEILAYYTGIEGSGTYTVEGNTITLTWTFDGDAGCGAPVGITFQGTGQDISASWQLEVEVPTTLCNECQDLTLPDCTDPELPLGLDNGTYTVIIEDHTSGNTYTQSVSVSDGGVDWNGTNTPGVFTPFSVFTVTIQDSNGDPVTWTSGYNEYNCVRLTFEPTTDTNPDV